MDLLLPLVNFWRIVHFTVFGLWNAFDDVFRRGRNEVDWQAETTNLTKETLAKWGSKDWAVVTGAAVGLGRDVAKVLLRSGCNVIVACRTTARGEEAIAHILEELREEGHVVPEGREVVSVPCDLGDLRSVEQFVKAVRGSGRRVKLFVGNAAVLATPYGLTPQGYINQVGVNFYANVLMVRGFAEMMKEAGCGGKIVMVSSRTAHGGQVDETEFANHKKLAEEGKLPAGYAKWHDRYAAYGNTKLAVLLYIEGLAKSLSAWNAQNPTAQVTVNTVHPGCLKTAIARDLPMNKLPGSDSMQARTQFSSAEGAFYVANVCLAETKQGTYYHMYKVAPKPSQCENEREVARVNEYATRCFVELGN